jgi:pyruvate,water dikinase
MSQLFAKDALAVPFELLRMSDVESVGGKNASLGEMISQLPNGVRVPTGFATTAHAFREFLKHGGLVDRINQKLDDLDVEDVRALVAVGAEIRAMVEAQPFPADLEKAIREQFAVLSAGQCASLLCGAFLGHCRRFARCVVRRPARNIFECGWR